MSGQTLISKEELLKSDFREKYHEDQEKVEEERIANDIISNFEKGNNELYYWYRISNTLFKKLEKLGYQVKYEKRPSSLFSKNTEMIDGTLISWSRFTYHSSTTTIFGSPDWISTEKDIENLVDSIKENGYVLEDDKNNPDIIEILCKLIVNSKTDLDNMVIFTDTLNTLVSGMYRRLNPRLYNESN